MNTRHLLGLVVVGLGLCAAQAQDFPPPSNLPPAAAPTSDVAVSVLPVVRSESQTVSDFAAGLVQGLMAAERVTAGEISVAQGDHADIERGFGAIGKSAATADSQFNTGNLSDVIAAIAVMQLSEQGRLKLDGSRYGAGVEGALARLVAAAGENFSAYAQTHIFAPLKMARSRIEANGDFVTSPADISKLMLALLNGGEAGDARILSAASVNAMMAPPGISENGFPDSAYGFGAVAREGWNSLERDSRTGVVAARLVLVP